VRVRGEERRLHAFHLGLSHSRYGAVVWSEREDELSWLAAHNGALRRLEGVPAVIRVDNAKTAVVRGAGAWGEIHPAYRRYAEAVLPHRGMPAARAGVQGEDRAADPRSALGR